MLVRLLGCTAAGGRCQNCQTFKPAGSRLSHVGSVQSHIYKQQLGVIKRITNVGANTLRTAMHF